MFAFSFQRLYLLVLQFVFITLYPFLFHQTSCACALIVECNINWLLNFCIVSLWHMGIHGSTIWAIWTCYPRPQRMKERCDGRKKRGFVFTGMWQSMKHSSDLENDPIRMKQYFSLSLCLLFYWCDDWAGSETMNTLVNSGV